MPKITGPGVPSHSGRPVPPQELDQSKFFKKEGDDVSPGSSSSPSEPSSEKTPDKPTKSDETLKPAPTTGNLSSPGQTASSSAPRTAGARGRTKRR